MSSNILTISLETSTGNGEDNYLTYEDESGSVTIGVFDGLGGRSAGFDGQKGGRIASTFASQTAESLLKDWKGNLTTANAIQLYNSIKTALKSEADAKMPVSRLKGTLAGKRLCTTVALANVSKCKQGKLRVKTAWMGDSRIYFLSENQGLQQLTLDDLEVKKDAFEMIREDPPMSKYISADSNPEWQINYSEINIDEQRGCFLACTDGCFQYLSTPWDFERLLLETLSIADSYQQWQCLLTEKYQQIKQDDVSLLIYPIGFSHPNDIREVKDSYKFRYQTLDSTYSSNISGFDDLVKLWSSYRNNYEARLIQIQVQIQGSSELIANVEVSQSTDRVASAINEKKETSNEKQLVEVESPIEINENAVGKEPQLPSFLSNRASVIKDVGDSISHEANEIVELYSEGFRLQSLSKYQEAIQIYSRIISLNPHNIDTNFQLGIIYSSQGEFDNAISYLEIVNNLQSTYGVKSSYLCEALINLARAYYEKNHYAKACIAFEQIVQSSHTKLDENNMQLYADALRKIERHSDAITICDEIKIKNPNNPFAFYIHGNILHTQNLLKDAERYLSFARTHFKKLFDQNRSPLMQQWLELADREYKEVKEKLGNQT